MAPRPRAAGWYANSVRWLGLAPFLVFTFAFMILPAGALLAGSFQDREGRLTLANFARLGSPSILGSFLTTIQLSVASAVIGGLLGILVAQAAVRGGLPSGVRAFVSTFSGVASNFAGVPLAFAFVSTLGRMGLVTTVLRGLGLDLYDAGFSLYSFWGLTLTYVYFQVPLMILVIEPALDGVRREWREAAESLGASAFQYWTRVGIPVLLPPILAALVLLFGNAFGAYATAYSLTGGLINIVPILIGAQIRGDVLHDPNLGYALALGMVAVMAVVVLAYAALQRLAGRWSR
jgi:putative spermidine/putrescine transport system permease protein